MKTGDFLDAVRLRHGLRSDYMVAKLMGTTTQNVSHWRSGARTMGEDACLKVAELIDVKPEFVLASVAAERAKGETLRQAWERAAAALAACLVAAVGLVTPPPASAAPAEAAGQCILCKAKRRKRDLALLPLLSVPILPGIRTRRV